MVSGSATPNRQTFQRKLECKQMNNNKFYMCYKLVITMSFLTLMRIFFFERVYAGIIGNQKRKRKEKAESDPAFLRLSSLTL